MSERIWRIPLDVPDHVFALRHHGRVACSALGCDEANQVRFATALSELGREAVAHGGGARAEFTLRADGALVVRIERFPRAALTGPPNSGLGAARRLLDDVAVGDAPGPEGLTVTLVRPPVRAGTVEPADVRAQLLRTAAPSGPMEQLQRENADLVGTLDELRAKQDELVRLNAELQETNRGVMAMYAQLTDELDETNRGVVALYAELDDKTVRLSEASEAKSRFLANVSHELRGPVNSLLALGGLLLEPDGDPLSDEQRKQIDLMLRSGTELSTLVNDLLDLAKAESGRLEPIVARVDLEALLGELRGALRPLLRPRVELAFDATGVGPLETDRTLLTQALRNLLTNAVKFTTAGSIRVTARRREGFEVEIAVADTGIGIAPADQPRVFEEFFQVRGALQAERRGTGLGLPYARRVVEMLGGRLSLQSALGEGSTFTVRLPVLWQPMLRAATSPAKADVADIVVDTVLIVDDDAAFRTVLRVMLQGIARNVLEASGGTEGLRLMREARPSLAFLDVRMPDMDGSAVLAQKNADPDLHGMPVVIVTSMELGLKNDAALGSVAALSKATITRSLVLQAVTEACGAPTR
ncbi:MAG TPA: ATP-binding protein [Candidatus Baltobacteraceae bacterium]|nr:ATP-binding protein [Candidatus Baltobacteraceae bacterium]